MILTTYKLTRTPVDHERFYLLLALSAATVTSERRRR